jgi:endonuclease YncB( thermonuclease family)
VCFRCFFHLRQPSRYFTALTISTVLLAPSASAAQRRSAPVLVRFVLDGDTIDVASVGRVRLLGIDAPEIGRGLDTAAPFAREAQQRLAGLVAHRWVRLEYEDGRDVYRRRLAYVFLETGQFVNELLVRDGLARVVAGRGLARLGELKRAEAAAQASRRGIWGARPSIPSETYRLPRPKRPVREGH